VIYVVKLLCFYIVGGARVVTLTSGPLDGSAVAARAELTAVAS
jgi:hypothetical protein